LKFQVWDVGLRSKNYFDYFINLAFYCLYKKLFVPWIVDISRLLFKIIDTEFFEFVREIIGRFSIDRFIYFSKNLEV
jgi:hypothetical protein